jgi:hypothetical protein
MIGYKLLKKRKDGTYGPLFINASKRMRCGEWYDAEEHRTKGYAFRPGWHLCARPVAPHLSVNDRRVWCMVEFEHRETMNRPQHQGGTWYLGSQMRILGELCKK